MDQEEIRQRVTAARVATFASVDAGGRPHAVPLCFALHGDKLYWAVDAKPKRSQSLRRIQNLRANPSVSILVHHYEEDWTRLWWVRLDGNARELGGEEREIGLRLLAEKYDQYRTQRPSGACVAVEIQRWTGWDASAAPDLPA